MSSWADINLTSSGLLAVYVPIFLALCKAVDIALGRWIKTRRTKELGSVGVATLQNDFLGRVLAQYNIQQDRSDAQEKEFDSQIDVMRRAAGDLLLKIQRQDYRIADLEATNAKLLAEIAALKGTG